MIMTIIATSLLISCASAQRKQDESSDADFINRGFNNFERGGYDLAMSDYNKALEIDPK
jgi:hypothetical protein